MLLRDIRASQERLAALADVQPVGHTAGAEQPIELFLTSLRTGLAHARAIPPRTEGASKLTGFAARPGLGPGEAFVDEPSVEVLVALDLEPRREEALAHQEPPRERIVACAQDLFHRHGIRVRKTDGQPQHTDQEWAEVVYVPNWTGHSRNRADYRFLAIREPLRPNSAI